MFNHLSTKTLALAFALSLAACSQTTPPPPTVGVDVTPGNAFIKTGATQTFSAMVSGSSQTDVTWQVEEGASAGTISSAGVYTAPTRAGTYHIKATSKASPAYSARAEVMVYEGQLVYGLDTLNRLVAFGSLSPAVVSLPKNISGLQAGEVLLDIDFRPNGGKLYALSSANRIYTVDLSTAAATAVRNDPLEVVLTAGQRAAIDFNPARDLLRIVNEAGQNLRVNPDTGAVVDGDPAVDGIQPDKPLVPPTQVVVQVAAVAYTDNKAGATTTTLYGLDLFGGRLVLIGSLNGNPSPNGGQVSFVANPFSTNLFNDPRILAGFDISGANGTALVSLSRSIPAESSSFFSIDLSNGQLTAIGTLGFNTPLRSIAIAP